MHGHKHDVVVLHHGDAHYLMLLPPCSPQAYMIPDMAHFMLLFTIIALMVSGVVNTVLGPRTRVVAGFDTAMYNMMKYLVLGSDGGMFEVG